MISKRIQDAWNNIVGIVRGLDRISTDTTPEMMFAAAHRIILQAEVIKGLTVRSRCTCVETPSKANNFTHDANCPDRFDKRAAAEFVERAIAEDPNCIYGKGNTND